MANIKISQLTAKSTNLLATDLLEVSEVSGLTYVSKKITGQQIIDGIGLSNYVPYTGASANVNLGEYEIKVGQLTLDTSPTGTAAVGTTRWNNTLGSTETTLKGGSVILKNGVDLVARVVNKVTPNATLTKANYTAVRVSGAQGQRLAVAYAQANNDNNSADTLGLVIETIPTNQEGFIMTVGQIENINTTGSLQGETWADGDVLYLSPTIPGAITKVKPTGATGHIVIIGYVEYAHANNGKIYVKIMNGWELDELHNVYINTGTLANNDALIYESSTQLWKNKTIAQALGYTPVTNARTITINGTTQDLSADRTFTVSSDITVGTTAVTSGTNGRVFFQAGGVVQQDGAFNWDNTNKRLGIGANATSPSAALNIRTNLITANDVLTLQNGQYGNTIFRVRDNATASQSTIGSIFVQARIYGSGSTLTGNEFDLGGYGLGASYGDAATNSVWLNNQGNVGDGSGSSVISVNSNLYVNLQTTKKYKFEATTGNFGIGNVGTLGARLDVRAQGALSTDIAFRVRNSADTQNLFSLSGNGNFTLGLANSYYISLNPSSPSLRGYNSTNVAWQLSPWTGEHCWLTNVQSNQVQVGIGITTPTSKLHVYTNADDTSIKIATGASLVANETACLKFSTTNAGTSAGQDALIIRARSKGTTSGDQKCSAEFSLNRNGTNDLRASITSQSNLLLQSPTENTNDVGVIYIPNGTAPTDSITDGFKQYSADITTGNAAPHFRTENGSIIKLYQNTAVTTPQGIADALTNLGVLATSTIAPSVQSVSSAATVTPTFANDLVKITAQAAALTLAAPTGTAIDGKDLVIRIKDNGSAQTITWTSGTGGYRAIGVTLPTTTTAGKTTYVGLIYNSDDSVWDAIGVTTQA
jgi:nitrogen fixation protein